jgi:hypothetical protein
MRENPEETKKRSIPMARPEMVRVTYVLGLINRRGERKMAETISAISHLLHEAFTVISS